MWGSIEMKTSFTTQQVSKRLVLLRVPSRGEARHLPLTPWILGAKIIQIKKIKGIIPNIGNKHWNYFLKELFFYPGCSRTTVKKRKNSRKRLCT
jgi:hypothetical protein